MTTATRDTVASRRALADLAVQLHQRAWAAQYQGVGMDAALHMAIEARVADFSVTLRGLVESGAYFQATGMFARNSEAERQFLLRAFPLMSEPDRAACLSDAWTRDLFGARALDGTGRSAVSPGALRSMFQNAPSLGAAAQAALFPGRKKEVVVYRGFGLRRPSPAGVVRAAGGLEWSPRRDIAAAVALSGEASGLVPVLVTASASRAAVLAFFNDSRQAECLIDARRLTAVRETRITAADRKASAALTQRRRSELP